MYRYYMVFGSIKPNNQEIFYGLLKSNAKKGKTIEKQILAQFKKQMEKTGNTNFSCHEIYDFMQINGYKKAI